MGGEEPRVHPGALCRNPDPGPPPTAHHSRAPSRPRRRLSRRSRPPEDTVDVVLQGRRHAAGPGGSGNLSGIGNKETEHRPPETRPGSRPLVNANIARICGLSGDESVRERSRSNRKRGGTDWWACAVCFRWASRWRSEGEIKAGQAGVWTCYKRCAGRGHLGLTDGKALW